MHQDPPDEDTVLLKPTEVAAHLRVSRMTVYRLINAGELPVVHIGARHATRVTRKALDAYVKKCGRGTSAA